MGHSSLESRPARKGGKLGICVTWRRKPEKSVAPAELRKWPNSRHTARERWVNWNQVREGRRKLTICSYRSRKTNQVREGRRKLTICSYRSRKTNQVREGRRKLTVCASAPARRIKYVRGDAN